MSHPAQQSSLGARLLLTTSYPRFPGDMAGHFVATEASASTQQGAVRVLAAGSPAPQAQAAPASPVELAWLGGPSLFRSPGALQRLKERPLRLVTLLGVVCRAQWALRSAREPTIVAHWLLPFGFCAAFENRLRRTAWLSPRGTFELELVAHGSDVRCLLALPPWLARRALHFLVDAGARFRFVSEELQCALLQLPKLNAATVTRLREADVRPASFELPALPEAAAAREALGHPKDEELVVLVGRLVTQKRVDVALRGALLVPGVRVVVLGDGPERTRLQTLFPTVEFLGELPRERALLWLRAAHLLVTASRDEGAPTVVREARALGTPVLSARAGDLPRWAETDAELWLFGT